MFIIGIDPHKGSHTAAVLDEREVVVGELACQRGSPPTRSAARLRGAVRTADLGRRGRRRARGVAGPAARRRRRDRLGRAAEAVGAGPAAGLRATPTRPTRTTPARRRSWRCAMTRCSGSGRSITPRCCGCWRIDAMTSSRCGPGPSAGCTPCCACSRRAASAQRMSADQAAQGPAQHPARRGRRHRTQAHGPRAPRRSPPPRPADRSRRRPHRRCRRRVGHDRHRGVRRRSDRRRGDHRPHRSRRTVPDRRALRPLQRHRPDRSVVGAEGPRIGSTRAGTDSSTTRSTWPPSPRSATTPPGRVYFDRKIAEGKTKKEAMRALKRRISDAVYRQLLADPAADHDGPGRASGTTLKPA